MDAPRPPNEPEVKNIIDKLANFVARNGAEFEKMTMDKQRGNPKFGFLFGGEHFNYYQYRLRTEQQNQNQHKAKLTAQAVAQEAIVQHSLQNAPWQNQPPVPPMMPPFNRFPPVQMQQPMGMGMRMPNRPPPPWQQNQGRGQQPPMSIPPPFPPSSGSGMSHPRNQPPNQGFQGGPPNNQGGPGPNMMPPQQMGPPPRQNFSSMFQQPPPSLPPQHQQQMPPHHQQHPPQNFPQDGHSMTPPLRGHEAPTAQEEKPVSEFEREEMDLAKEEEEANKKIDESKNNLDQQFNVLMQQQQEKIEVAIGQAQENRLNQLAGTTGVMLPEFDGVLLPVINTCTKDSISTGKSWILSNSKTANHCEVIARYLLKKVLDAEKSSPGDETGGRSKFDTQLHLVYLINDVLHHAPKKHLNELSAALQSVIVPIFCMASGNAPEARKERLTKLLGLWEKFKYFSQDVLAKLKDPSKALSEYQANLIIEHAAAVKGVQVEVQGQLSQYQKQHDQYASHIKQQIEKKKSDLENRKAAEAEKAKLESQRNEERSSQDFHSDRREDYEMYDDHEPPWEGGGPEFDPNHPMHFDYGHSNNQPPQVIDYSHQRNPSEWQEEEFPPPQWGPRPRGPRMKGPWHEGGGPPPWRGPGPRPRPPLRGPRPPLDPNDPSLIPTVPYYDLPAGLMCPLVKLEDSDYKPLDPTRIRLPPPVPPSERLLAAVEAFYAPPSRDRPRNVDGWEHNGLFEFYRAKVRAKRQKEGGDVSPARSKSRSRSRSRSRRRSRSRSSSSRSRSISGSRSSRSSSRSRSRSPRGRPARGSSVTPPRRARSPTPTQIHGMPLETQEGRLGEENRGAQMMKKMGWGGAGLGAKEQGRDDPVSAGEVRDKYDMYKGLGMPSNDPYESFRKSKSQGFITRIKARDKERDRKKETMVEDADSEQR